MVQVGVVVVLAIILAILGVVLVGWVRALGELRRGVEALGEGKPARPILSRVGGPVGRLAQLFDTIAPQLEDRIARLEQDRQQLRAVLSGMAEGVIAIDARRRLLFANASANRLFGLDGGAVGRLVPELIRSPRVQEAVEATLSGAGAISRGRSPWRAASRCSASMRGSWPCTAPPCPARRRPGRSWSSTT